MAKIALLLGISEYDEPEFNRLPGTQKDIEAMESVLRDSAIGGFDEVKVLPNPDPVQMQMAIQTLFSEREREDLVLLYFSGHGITDREGNFYITSCKTRKNLFQSTTVSASFVHGIMSNSNAKRQVIILDCCYSGAFARDWQPKAKSFHEWALLTSSTFARISLGDDESGIYSRYLIEGLKTGAADTNSDGVISIDELHNYAKKKVQEAAPAMNPELHPIKEGYKIKLAQAPRGKAELEYRKAFEEIADEDNGEICAINRQTLNALRNKLGLLLEEATIIEEEVLKPFREKQKNLQIYRQNYFKLIQQEYPLSELSSRQINRLQNVLQLKDKDVESIKEEFIRLSKTEITRENTNNFGEMKLCLNSALKLLQEFAKKLNLENSITALERIRERCENRLFSIAIVGEFQRGKSTLINALIGQEILPSDILISSAIPIRINCGKTPLVKLLFKDGREEFISIKQIHNIISESSEIIDNLKEAIIYYPLNYCENNVNIIDTPGLNDDTKKSEVTLSVLSQVDVVIFVISAQAPFAESEKQFLQNILLQTPIGKILFVVNRLDLCNRPEEARKIVLIVKNRIDKVLNMLEQQYGKDSPEYEIYTKKIGEQKVFGLSAYKALEGKLKCDAKLVVDSRFREFEAVLERLIFTQREEICLQIALNEIIMASTKIMKKIVIQEETLGMKQEELNEMRVQTQKILANARSLSEKLISSQSL